MISAKKNPGLYMDNIFRKATPYKWNALYVIWGKKEKAVIAAV